MISARIAKMCAECNAVCDREACVYLYAETNDLLIAKISGFILSKPDWHRYRVLTTADEITIQEFIHQLQEA